MNGQSRKQEAEMVLDGFVNLLGNLLDDVSQEVEKGAQKAETKADEFFRKIEKQKRATEESELIKQFKLFEEIATLEAVKKEAIKAGVETKGFLKKVNKKLEVLQSQVK
jgi:hypothetical protein